MIKINLLPYRAERKKQQIIDHIIVVCLSCIPVIIGIIISFVVINFKISNISDEIIKTAEDIKRQQATVEKIKSFKATKDALLKKMDIIKTLQKNKSGPVHIMEQLSINLPGKLWLTSLKQSGMELKIEGTALDNQSISKYMINLEKSSYFKSVDLDKISTEDKPASRGIGFKHFSLKCTITYTGK
jgi:type IV pilus assembly protein PilN